jgi:hypothetical protein
LSDGLELFEQPFLLIETEVAQMDADADRIVAKVLAASFRQSLDLVFDPVKSVRVRRDANRRARNAAVEYDFECVLFQVAFDGSSQHPPFHAVQPHVVTRVEIWPFDSRVGEAISGRRRKIDCGFHGGIRGRLARSSRRCRCPPG